MSLCVCRVNRSMVRVPRFRILNEVQPYTHALAACVWVCACGSRNLLLKLQGSGQPKPTLLPPVNESVNALDRPPEESAMWASVCAHCQHTWTQGLIKSRTPEMPRACYVRLMGKAYGKMNTKLLLTSVAEIAPKPLLTRV